MGGGGDDAAGELAMALRGAVVRGLVSGVRDDGATQTLDAETHEGVARSAVEVLQPYGLATSPPGDGAVALLLAVGGDQGDLVALVPACPDSRFGNLAPGEVALYDARGNRVHIREGGRVEVRASASVRVEVGGAVLEVTDGKVRITGDLEVSGQVSDARGPMQEMRDTYNAHSNPRNGADPPPQRME